MGINAISGLSTYVSGLDKFVVEKDLGVDPGNKSEKRFETVMDRVIAQELLKPVLSSSVFAGDNSYSQIVSNAFLQFISEKMQFHIVGNLGGSND